MKKLSFIAILLLSVVWLLSADAHAKDELNKLDSVTFSNTAVQTVTLSGALPPGETRRSINVKVTNKTSGDIWVYFSKIDGTADTVSWHEVIKAGEEWTFTEVRQPKIHIKSFAGSGKALISIVRGGGAFPYQRINGNTTNYDSVYKIVSLYQLKDSVTAINRPLRISRVGTSITDEDHVSLDYGVGSLLADYLYNQIGKFVTPANATISGTNYSISNMRFYGGTARKITGVNSYVEFQMYGNEVSLLQGLERSNKGASIIDLYVNDTLYDSFSNYNIEPSGTTVHSFTGNGTQTKFPLGRNFNYNPTALTVDGVSKTVKQVTYTNSGISFGGFDAVIIRKWQKINGQAEVRNYIWFATAPANGHVVSLTTDYGENIAYVKHTLSETKDSLGSAIETFQGDRAYDSTSATIYEDALNFRQTDERAVKTWRFSNTANRKIKFQIRSLDSRATGTPYFIFNGASNRFHHVQNAGIYGYTAYGLAEHDPTSDLRTYVQIRDFKPDIVLFESGTNDGDANFNYYLATRQTTGVDSTTIRRYPVLFIKTLTYDAPNSYTLNSAVLKILSATKNTVQINDTNVTYTNTPIPGDVLVIGSYHTDVREFTTRVISSWDNTTKTATFDEPLFPNEILGVSSYADLVNADVKIYNTRYYKKDVDSIVNGIRKGNPKTLFGLFTGGLQDHNRRNTLAFPVLQNKIAIDKGLYFGNILQEFITYQYSQKKDVQVYLNNNSNTVSDGSSTYILKTNTWGNPDSLIQRNSWSVKVNGVERYGDGCYIEGGRRGTMPKSYTPDQLVASSFNNAWGKFSNDAHDVILSFTKNVPANGDSIVVKYASVKASDDDTHPNYPNGYQLYWNVYKDVLHNLVNSFYTAGAVPLIDTNNTISTKAYVNVKTTGVYNNSNLDTSKIANENQYNVYTAPQTIKSKLAISNLSYTYNADGSVTIMSDTALVIVSPKINKNISTWAQLIDTACLRVRFTPTGKMMLMWTDIAGLTYGMDSTGKWAFPGDVTAKNDFITFLGRYLVLGLNTTATTGIAMNSTADGVLRVRNAGVSADAIMQLASLILTGVPTYNDNADAISGGLTTNKIYRTPTGALMIVY